MKKDTKARKAVEGVEKNTDGSEHPPAGPHAKKELTDKTKTPGAGSLPDEKDDSVSPGSG
jgi:hypothetical protein